MQKQFIESTVVILMEVTRLASPNKTELVVLGNGRCRVLHKPQISAIKSFNGALSLGARDFFFCDF
jgi:hypothetical protein